MFSCRLSSSQPLHHQIVSLVSIAYNPSSKVLREHCNSKSKAAKQMLFCLNDGFFFLSFSALTTVKGRFRCDNS